MEHVFKVMKQRFGFTKLRYKGLPKIMIVRKGQQRSLASSVLSSLGFVFIIELELALQNNFVDNRPQISICLYLFKSAQ